MRDLRCVVTQFPENLSLSCAMAGDRWSSFSDRAPLALKLDGTDPVARHVHFGKPRCKRFLIRSFHHTEDLALGQVAKAAVRFDYRILFGRLGQPIYLFTFHCPRRQRMGAHKLWHRTTPSKRT